MSDSRPAQHVRAVALLFAVGLLGPGGEVSAREPTDCGALAIYSLLRFEKRPTELTDLQLRLSEAPRDGHSMKKLRDVARSSGLRLEGVALKKDPRAIDRPMVIFVRRGEHGHYVVIRPVGHTGNLVQVIDSIHSVEVMDKSDLIASPEWTGLALVPQRHNWLLVVFGGLLGVVVLSAVLPQFVRRTNRELRLSYLTLRGSE